MLKVKEEMAGKVEFDFGSEIGTRKLSNNLPQEQLQRIAKLSDGHLYVEEVVEEKKNEKEVSDGETI